MPQLIRVLFIRHLPAENRGVEVASVDFLKHDRPFVGLHFHDNAGLGHAVAHNGENLLVRRRVGRIDNDKFKRLAVAVEHAVAVGVAPSLRGEQFARPVRVERQRLNRRIAGRTVDIERSADDPPQSVINVVQNFFAVHQHGQRGADPRRGEQRTPHIPADEAVCHLRRRIAAQSAVFPGKLGSAGAGAPLVGRQLQPVKSAGKQHLKSGVGVRDHFKIQILQTRSGAERRTDIAVIAFKYRPLVADAALQPVWSAADQHFIAPVIVVEFFSVERLGLIRPVQMARQRLHPHSQFKGAEIRFAPHHDKLAVGNHVEPLQSGVKLPVRSAVHIGIQNHVDIKFEVGRGNRYVPVFASRLRIGEVLPEYAVAQFDAVGQMVGRHLPAFGQHPLIFLRIPVVAFGQRSVGQSGKHRGGSLVGQQRIQNSGVGAD